jgi:hypothetical protein
MSFGFRSLNDGGVLQIDSETPVLSVIESGSYAPTGQENGLASYITYHSPILTMEPPLFFIRPIGNTRTVFARPLGTPGNWTGFYIRGYSSDFPQNGKWFCAAFIARATASFGMRLWAADRTILFDSGCPLVNVTDIIRTWSYSGQETVGAIGEVINWARFQYSFPAETYLMINSFSMNLIGFDSRNVWPISRWDFTAGYMYAGVQGHPGYGRPTNNLIPFPAVFAKIKANA